MPAFNLLRNTRAFFTTNVAAATGAVNLSGFTNTNTFEIQVLDGLSFSQATTEETVTINEAGSAPSRGQRSFNTALDPVEFSMSTYIRPKYNEGGATDTVVAEEAVLWNAFTGTDVIGNAGAGWTATSDATTPYSTVAWTNSNVHQLQKFGMIFLMDGAAYVIDNCALDQATIDFGLDAIATIAWTGRGTLLRQVEGATATSGASVTFGGGLSGSAKGKDTTARYISNKLSTCTMVQGINGGGTSYNIPITGGSVTFANNLTYLTPANLGVVNQPVTYFTGTRAISGNITAYLKTGDTNTTSDLLQALLTGSTTEIAPGYSTTIAIGGSGNATRVELAMPACKLSIPSVNTEQVVSVGINFTAHASTASAYDLSGTNEATVKYYAAA